MVFAVLPALIPDIRKVYDMYFAAFGAERMGELMLQILFPGGIDSEEFRKAHTEGTLSYWHTSDTQYTFKCVDMSTGEIVGMALGDVYIRERTDEERKFLGVPWLEGEQRERAEKVLKPLHEIREKLLGGAPHIYSHVMGVDPKHQGKKAGAVLAKFGLELGEKTCLPIYFEASPSVIGLYVKLGYEVLNETVVHKGELFGQEEDIVVPLVIKMPSAAKGMTFYEWREKGYPRLG